MKKPFNSPFFYIGLCATAISIGLAIDSQWGGFEVIPQNFSIYVSWLSVVLIIIAIFFIVISIVGFIHTLDYITILRVRFGEVLLNVNNSSVQYSTYKANHQDINTIFNLCVEKIGPGASRPKKMKAWLRHNDSIFYKLVPFSDEDGDVSRNIQAYFCIIPLTKKAVNHLESDELDGASFTTDHICKTSRNATAWYIGGIAGRNRFSQVSAMRSLISKIRVAKDAPAKLYYTRPITDRGLDIVRRLEFEPLSGNGTVQRDELCKLLVDSNMLKNLKKDKRRSKKAECKAIDSVDA